MASPRNGSPAASIILALKDLIRDLEVFAGGRGTAERYYMISSEFYRLMTSIQDLNPDKPKSRLPMVAGRKDHE